MTFEEAKQRSKFARAIDTLRETAYRSRESHARLYESLKEMAHNIGELDDALLLLRSKCPHKTDDGTSALHTIGGNGPCKYGCTICSAGFDSNKVQIRVDWMEPDTV